MSSEVAHKKDAAKAYPDSGKQGFMTGIENPLGALWTMAATSHFLFIPIALKLTQPGSFVGMLVYQFWTTLIPGSPNIAPDRVIPALATIYVSFTFAVSGAFSVAGYSMGRSAPFDNEHQRSHTTELTGLPLRMRSAHWHLMEMFPGWAITAALAQSIAPADAQILNLLGLHVISKIGVHYPAYVMNMSNTRSTAHLVATSSLIATCYRIATISQ